MFGVCVCVCVCVNALALTCGDATRHTSLLTCLLALGRKRSRLQNLVQFERCILRWLLITFLSCWVQTFTNATYCRVLILMRSPTAASKIYTN